MKRQIVGYGAVAVTLAVSGVLFGWTLNGLLVLPMLLTPPLYVYAYRVLRWPNESFQRFVSRSTLGDEAWLRLHIWSHGGIAQIERPPSS